MKAAIAQLEESLSTNEANEIAYFNEGNTKQADTCAVNASEIRQALAVLKAAAGGPIWPLPRA